MLTGYGGPEATVVREIPRPEPGPGEILVRVHAAGLNPVDFKTREGMLKIVQRYPLPITMGTNLPASSRRPRQPGHNSLLVIASSRGCPRNPWARSQTTPSCRKAFWPGCPRRLISLWPQACHLRA
ncbi:alcohol dehydrogenase catalytic domain-containing protein [Novosphingobium pentaromativorans]|uniref:alcohol dehydrogenase catalytic domain-containing protein n=1 Tax=Novosphingobium pentaromativorans TaxID=205844 RepID=UPI003B75CE01